MSFFNSKPWAKIPTDLLENKAMLKAEKMLDESLRSAPVLFYLAGAMKADDDGIFDTGDGEEFAALIKVKSPEIVCTVASAMVKMHIFAHVPESSVYMFVEWEYNTRQPEKTLRKRWELAHNIWKNKREELQYFNIQSTKIDSMRTNDNPLVNKCSNTIQDEVNKCCNTIQGPAAPSLQIRREREDKRETEQIIQDVEKNTHTRVEGVGGEELPAASEPMEGSTAAFSENSIDVEQKSSEESEKLITVPNWEVLPENDVPETEDVPDTNKETEDASFMPEENEKIKGEAFSIFQNFFKSENLAYNESKGAKAVKGIVQELYNSVENKDDVPRAARAICDEFKKMNKEPLPNKWHGIPLYPTYMSKEVVWAYLLNHASFPAVPIRTTPLTQEEREETDEWFESEFRAYGIDPEAPNAVVQLMLARSRQNAAESV